MAGGRRQDAGGYGLFEPKKNSGTGAKTETWEGITLTWVANRGELGATHQGERATGKGKELLDGLPDAMRKRVLKNRNAPACIVTIRRHGASWLEIVQVRLTDEASP